MVSRYCQNFLSNSTICKNIFCIRQSNCWYFFLDSNRFSMSVSMWHFLLKTVLRKKFIFPKSVRYLKEPIGKFIFSWFWNSLILFSMFRSIMSLSVVLLWALLSIVTIHTLLVYYKALALPENHPADVLVIGSEYW